MSDSEWEGLKDEWEHRDLVGPSSAVRWVLMLVMAVLTAVVIAALVLDLFGGDETPAAGDDPIASEGPGAAEEAAGVETGEPVTQGAEPDTITFSSIPDHRRYVGAWTDGEVVIELKPDGTYELRTADSLSAGSFKMAVVDDADYLELLDPDDPSGLTVAVQVPLDLDGGTLVYGAGENARRLEEVADGAEVVLAPTEPPGPFAVDASMVTVAQGRYTFRIHSNQVGDCGTQSVRTELADYDVDLLLDPGAGTLTGSASATYSCTDCNAAQTVTAAATLDIGSSTVTGEGGVWSYSGTAVVDMALAGATADNRGSCEWGDSGQYEVPFQGTLFVGTPSTGSLEMAFDEYNSGLLEDAPNWRWSFFLNFRTG